MAYRVRPDLLALFLIAALATPHAGWAGEKVRFVDLMSVESGHAVEANDHPLFAGLIPGKPLAEDELDEYYGQGRDPRDALSALQVELGKVTFLLDWLAIKSKAIAGKKAASAIEAKKLIKDTAAEAQALNVLLKGIEDLKEPNQELGRILQRIESVLGPNVEKAQEEFAEATENTQKLVGTFVDEASAIVAKLATAASDFNQRIADPPGDEALEKAAAVIKAAAILGSRQGSQQVNRQLPGGSIKLPALGRAHRVHQNALRDAMKVRADALRRASSASAQ